MLSCGCDVGVSTVLPSFVWLWCHVSLMQVKVQYLCNAGYGKVQYSLVERW